MVGVRGFEPPTPCSQSMGQFINLPSTRVFKSLVVSRRMVSRIAYFGSFSAFICSSVDWGNRVGKCLRNFFKSITTYCYVV